MELSSTEKVGLFIYDVDKVDKNEDSLLISEEYLNMPLTIRHRKPGDRMQYSGLNGSKKIKDIFIDQKISLSDRNIWPVVVDSDNNVVWLPGLRKSKYDKQKQEKYDIILKYQQGGKNNE